jgi:hypothetical protein
MGAMVCNLFWFWYGAQSGTGQFPLSTARLVPVHDRGGDDTLMLLVDHH